MGGVIVSELNVAVNYTITDDLYNKLLKFAYKYADKIAYEINRRLAVEQYNEARRITKHAIDVFYSSYGPHLYQRTFSLYDIFDIQVMGDDFIFAIDDDLMGWHRSNEAVMELDFYQGYHGGRKWRTPPHISNGVGMMVRTEGDEYKWATHSWQYWHYKPAVSTEPPYNIISSEWSSFLHGKYKQLKSKIVLDVVGEFVKYL